MADTNPQASPANILQEPRKLPGTLNVITILTFIGSGLAFLSQIYSFINAKASYEQIVQNRDKFDRMPGFVKSMMGGDPVEMALRSYDNRFVLLILNVVAVALCAYGALQMRKWKKAGFPIYVIGELLPFVGYMIFIGSLGTIPMLFSLLFAAGFIIIYATQQKYLS